MNRMLGLLLVWVFFSPGIAGATVYMGTGSIGGVFGGWDQNGIWQQFWISYSGPMRLNYDKRYVPDPEIALDLSTLSPVDWGLDGGGTLGTAPFLVSSMGYVPHVFMPPGYGPMALILKDVTMTPPVFVFTGNPDPVGTLLDVNAGFASNGYNLPFTFHGEAVPEPSSLWLLAPGLGMALACAGITRYRGIGRSPA